MEKVQRLVRRISVRKRGISHEYNKEKGMIIAHDLSKLCVSLYIEKEEVKEDRTQTMIFNPVCLHYICKLLNITNKQLFSSSRKDELVKARYLYYWYLCHSTKFSLSDIGATFNKDHTNVIHGLRALDEYKKEKELIKKRYGKK